MNQFEARAGLSLITMQNPAPIIEEPDKRPIPLSVRTLDRFPSPIIAALVSAIILSGAYLAGEWMTGGVHNILIGAESSLGLRATATLFVLACYIPLAHLYLRRWTSQHLAELRSSFGEVINFEQSAPAGLIAGLVGAASFLGLFMIAPILTTGLPTPTYQLVTASIGGTIFGWFTGRFLVCLITDSLRMSTLARSLPKLDLLDLGPLSPFVQQGLKSALLTVIVLALTSHLYIAPGTAIIGSSVSLLVWGIFTLLVFTLPVRGIRDRILQEKQTRLHMLRSEMRKSIKQVQEHNDREENTRLSALLELEIRLERVRAWPYDASSWLKLGLYMIIGLGSWVGAAAIERLLEWAL